MSIQNTSDWGVTAKGFRRPVYTELLDALEYKARELFGANADLTVRSPLGIFLRIFAWMLNLLFQLMEDVYNSRFVDTAVGASLYNLGRVIGLGLLPAQKASGYLVISGLPRTVVPLGFLAATISGFQYTTMTEAVIGEDGTATVPIRAFNAGEDYNAEPGAVQQIVNPIDGIHSITNPGRIIGGQERETDEKFRDRYYASVDFAGGVNADAVASEVFQNVEGVYSVLAYENDTDFTDALGLPPHSLELVVYGGLDTDIAQAIFRRKSGGIQTSGNVTVPVVSASGQLVEIHFSRPIPRPVWIQIYNLVTSEAFPADGCAQICQTLIKFIGGNISGGQMIGQDVVYMAIPSIIYQIPGVKDFDFQLSGDGVKFGFQNIEIGTREKAVTDEGKVLFI